MSTPPHPTYQVGDIVIGAGDTDFHGTVVGVFDALTGLNAPPLFVYAVRYKRDEHDDGYNCGVFGDEQLLAGLRNIFPG